MFTPLLRGFSHFPEEGRIVGRLLAAYGELEIDVMNCVAVGTDIDTAVKGLYRHRGETRRIDVAERLGGPYYATHKLDGEFAAGICAVRYCLKIRNLYAHCQWCDDNSGELAFVDLEELARRNDAIKDLNATRCHVDVAFLKDQEVYFQETAHYLHWLNYESRHLAGELPTRLIVKPSQRTPPPLRRP